MIVPLGKRQPEPRDDQALVDEAIDPKRGRHPYQRFAANRKAAAPHVHVDHLHRLTGAGHRPTLGTGDARPVVLRPGSTDHQQFPSRRHNRLVWPDGRITALDGVTPIAATDDA